MIITFAQTKMQRRRVSLKKAGNDTNKRKALIKMPSVQPHETIVGTRNRGRMLRPAKCQTPRSYDYT